jgi:hypothetical protein
MTCPDLSVLQAFLRGAISPAVAEHVEACPACQNVLATLTAEPDDLERELRQAAREDEFTDAECQRAVAALDRANPSASYPTRPPAPVRLAGYELLSPIGEPSGMGVVYKARQPSVGNRTVAVKVIRPDRVGPDALARFQREIVAGGMLEHPNIVRVYDAGVADGQPFLVMEFLDGMSLAGLVKARGPLPIADACGLVRQAAIGLDYAHRCGIIHRDLKPANLFLTRLGQVKLLDLGLARLTAATDEERLTQPGVGMGTPAYMAPEQAADAHKADVRSDLYGLGAVFFRLLTGRPPSSGRLRDLRPDVPEVLAALIDRLLDVDPAGRPASAAEVVAALRPFAGEREVGALLGGVSAGPVEALDAALDMLLWDERERRHVSLAEPGVLPLRPGTRFQLEVRLTRPAFVYLVWITTEGEAQPLYPWQGGRWEAYRAAGKVERLFLPLPEADGTYRPWTLTGPSGVETLVLLAHADPLPESAVRKLSGRLSGFGRPGDVGDLADPSRGYWFTCREEEYTRGTRIAAGSDYKGVDFRGAPLHDPIFQIHSLMRDRLGDRFHLIRAVSFANLGNEGGTP